jgi:hypothetical protein
MTPEEVTAQLEAIAKDESFEGESDLVVENWKSAGVGEEEVSEAILRFMEQHPTIDYGSPGPLVHFMEGSYKIGGHAAERWERLVIESIERKPTVHTLFLLNRIINVASPNERQRLLQVMADALLHPIAGELAKEEAQRYLDHQASKHS